MTVVAGMFVATALTLYVTPVIYASLATFVRWLRPSKTAPRVVTAAAVLLVVSAEARSAEALDLGDALAAANEQNLDLRAQEHLTEVARATYARAVANLAPTLIGTGSTIWGRDQRLLALGTNGPYAQASARLTVPLVDASSWSSIRAARLRREAAELGEDATREAVLAMAGFAYINLLRAEQQVVETRGIAGPERAARRPGRGPRRGGRGGANRAHPGQRRRRAGPAARNRGADRAERRADEPRGILGLPLATELTVEGAGPVTEPPAGDPNRPNLAAARSEAEAAIAEVRAARNGFAPTVDAFGIGGALVVGGIVDPAGNPTTNVNPLASVGVEATVPFFTGTARDARDVRARRALAANAAVQVEDLERQVQVNVAVADGAVRDGAQGWEIAKQARSLAEQELALAGAASPRGSRATSRSSRPRPGSPPPSPVGERAGPLQRGPAGCLAGRGRLGELARR